MLFMNPSLQYISFSFWQNRKWENENELKRTMLQNDPKLLATITVVSKYLNDMDPWTLFQYYAAGHWQSSLTANGFHLWYTAVISETTPQTMWLAWEQICSDSEICQQSCLFASCLFTTTAAQVWARLDLSVFNKAYCLQILGLWLQ